MVARPLHTLITRYAHGGDWSDQWNMAAYQNSESGETKDKGNIMREVPLHVCSLDFLMLLVRIMFTHVLSRERCDDVESLL